MGVLSGTHARALLAISLLAMMALNWTPGLSATPTKNAVARVIEAYQRLRAYALNRASDLREQGMEEQAETLEEAVQTADSLMQEAKEAYQAGDLETASEKVREAFNTTREALIAVGESPGEMAARRLMAAIARHKRALRKLRSAVQRVENLGIDVSELKDDLARADTLLQEAEDLVREGNLAEATQKVSEAHRILVSVASRLREIAREVLKDRIMERSDEIVQAVERTISRLEEAEQRLILENKTQAAAKVAEVRQKLEDLLEDFHSCVQSGDEEGVEQILIEMVRALRSIARYLRGPRRG